MRISDWSSDVCSSDLKAKAEKPVADYEPQVRTTKLSGTFGGQRINYAATIGETIIKNKDGVPEVAVVTTSYVKEPRDPNRPITFRSEEHTSELQSLIRISSAVYSLKKKTIKQHYT